ncbi:MAG: acetyltransferase [Opitutales bacterium]
MKILIIIGAGGFGREVLAWAEQTYDFASEWRFGGFLDDNFRALNGLAYQERIISNVAAYQPKPDDRFLCAVGRPGLKERLVQPVLEKGGRFASLIHPTVVVGRKVTIGHGAILCPRVVLTSDIILGDFVSLNVGTAVGHDVVIGDWSQTSAFCDLTGASKVGRKVFLGSRASVLPKVAVGDEAVIGAGSVVVRDVKAGQTVFGVPAVPLRTR